MWAHIKHKEKKQLLTRLNPHFASTLSNKIHFKFSTRPASSRPTEWIKQMCNACTNYNCKNTCPLWSKCYASKKPVKEECLGVNLVSVSTSVYVHNSLLRSLHKNQKISLKQIQRQQQTLDICLHPPLKCSISTIFMFLLIKESAFLACSSLNVTSSFPWK
jgi:hypothetical protein